MIKVVVFDFDDCLVKSEHIKQAGFVVIFSDTVGAGKIAQDYIAKHQGQPRYQTIKAILTDLRDKKITHILYAEPLNRRQNVERAEMKGNTFLTLLENRKFVNEYLTEETVIEYDADPSQGTRYVLYKLKQKS